MDAGTATYQYLVVYDPEGGFVTGGGWIYSPEGAYTLDPSLSGKASGGIIHLINSGSTTLDATAQQQDEQGKPVLKPFWEMHAVPDQILTLDSMRSTIREIRDYGFEKAFILPNSFRSALVPMLAGVSRRLRLELLQRRAAPDAGRRLPQRRRSVDP